MARLPALVDLIASFGGTERKTIEQQARVLREANLLSRGKRGTGAPEMTCGDAAVILLAGMATDAATSAPDTVCAYLCMKRHAVSREPAAGTPERALFELAAAASSPLVLIRNLIAHSGAMAPPASEDGDRAAARFRVSLDRVSRTVAFQVKGRGADGGVRGTSLPAGPFSIAWSANADRPGAGGAPLMACTVTLGGDAFRRVGRLVLGGPAPRASESRPEEEEFLDEAPGLRP